LHSASPIGRKAKPTSRQRIIEAAITRFGNIGAADTTMEDIAAEAGLGRKTLYRTFSNRSALVEAVAVYRLDHMVDLVNLQLRKCATLEQALIVGSIEIIRLARKDRIFMSIVTEAGELGIEHYLIAPSSPVFNHAESMWNETFTKARKRKEWKNDLSEKEVKTWLRAVHLILLLRDDLDAVGQESLLRTFVLPALIKKRQRMDSRPQRDEACERFL